MPNEYAASISSATGGDWRDHGMILHPTDTLERVHKYSLTRENIPQRLKYQIPCDYCVADEAAPFPNLLCAIASTVVQRASLIESCLLPSGARSAGAGSGPWNSSQQLKTPFSQTGCYEVVS
jgi:hypothetical protein